jgi:hypothetical protein
MLRAYGIGTKKYTNGSTQILGTAVAVVFGLTTIFLAWLRLRYLCAAWAIWNGVAEPHRAGPRNSTGFG